MIHPTPDTEVCSLPMGQCSSTSCLFVCFDSTLHLAHTAHVFTAFILCICYTVSLTGSIVLLGCAMLLCCPLLCCIFCVLGHKTQSISNRVKCGDTRKHRVYLTLYSVYTGTCMRTCTMHMSAVNNPVPQRPCARSADPGLTIFSNSLLDPVSSKQSSQYSLVSTVFSMISKKSPQTIFSTAVFSIQSSNNTICLLKTPFSNQSCIEKKET